MTMEEDRNKLFPFSDKLFSFQYHPNKFERCVQGPFRLNLHLIPEQAHLACGPKSRVELQRMVKLAVPLFGELVQKEQQAPLPDHLKEDNFGSSSATQCSLGKVQQRAAVQLYTADGKSINEAYKNTLKALPVSQI